MSFGKFIFCGSQYLEYTTLAPACCCIDTGITANTALNFIILELYSLHRAHQDRRSLTSIEATRKRICALPHNRRLPICGQAFSNGVDTCGAEC